jgi:hypothetical protein
MDKTKCPTKQNRDIIPYTALKEALMRSRITKEDLLLEQWKMASELHRHMDNMIGQRFHHFVTVNGILLSALGVIWSRIAPGANQSTIVLASAAISGFGLVFSLAWCFIHKRGYKFHRYRKAQARRAEEQLIVDNGRVLSLYEKPLNKQKLIPVGIFERVPTYSIVLVLAILLTVMWLITMVYFLMLQFRP